jgi:hypothetical protein
VAGVFVVPVRSVLLVTGVLADRRSSRRRLDVLGPIRANQLVVRVVVHDWVSYPTTVIAAFMPPP